MGKYKYKKGELEAITILRKKGLKFDENYYDNNSYNSMPDFRLSNGNFLEVTHTKHNNKEWTASNVFFHKSFEERCKIVLEAQIAYNHLCQDEYEKYENGNYTSKGNMERNKDKAIVKEHYGYDYDTHNHQEFKCNVKAMKISINNVLNEILIDKASKYPEGNVELFIFILREEYEAIIGDKKNFLVQAMKSSFKTIYLCVWDMFKQTYEVENPILKKVNLGDNPPSIENY